MANVSYKRHIAKTITWRLVGTLDTIFLSWIITGNPLDGLKIGLAELTTKTVLYYLHERVWCKINLSKEGILLESRKRHIAKIITWRFIGTIDTMTLAWIISGNPLAAIQIGFAEVITKMVLYYLQERAWYRVNFGLTKRNKS